MKNNKKLKESNKGISPVIAIALLLVVGVLAVVSFQIWFQEYSSSIFSETEVTSKVLIEQKIEINNLVDGILYITNNIKDNLTINQLKIGNETCIVTNDLRLGVNIIPVSDCVKNLESKASDVVVTTNKNVITKKVLIKNENGNKNTAPVTSLTTVIEDTPVDANVTEGRISDIGGQTWTRTVESGFNTLPIGTNWKEIELDVTALDYAPWKKIDTYIGLSDDTSTYVYFYITATTGAWVEVAHAGGGDSYDNSGYVQKIGSPTNLKVVNGDTNIEVYLDDVLIIQTPTDASYPPANGGSLHIRSTDDEWSGWETNINHVVVRK